MHLHSHFWVSLRASAQVTPSRINSEREKESQGLKAEAKDGDVEVRQEVFLSRNQKNVLHGTEYRGGRVAFDFVSSSRKATIQIGYSFSWSKIPTGQPQPPVCCSE